MYGRNLTKTLKCRRSEIEIVKAERDLLKVFHKYI